METSDPLICMDVLIEALFFLQTDSSASLFGIHIAVATAEPSNCSHIDYLVSINIQQSLMNLGGCNFNFITW